MNTYHDTSAKYYWRFDMIDTLGSVIARRRTDKEMSQRELAMKVHVSNSTIARIENGYRKKPVRWEVR